jgi:hypothetical protein
LEKYGVPLNFIHTKVVHLGTTTTATQCTQRVGLVRGLIESQLGFVVQTAQPHSFDVVAATIKATFSPPYFLIF